MSYLVFARKWRPQAFADVLAQEHITVTLMNAIRTGRTGHAYLFTGPRGVGKTTTARILAKALNCGNGPTPEPCQECPSCLRITAGTDLDVLEIDGASNRGIDEIRDLREKARYSSAAGRWKIYIIDEVHMLTREAFNALLKILEEPPPSVLFVFATTEPRKVPATIVSRCQRFDFRRIPAGLMASYIAREAEKEGIEIEPDALSMVTRASGGSLRDALSIMDQLVSFAGGRITRESAAGLLRVVEDEILENLVRAILSGRQGDALDTVSAALERGYGVEELCDSFVEFLRNLMLAASGGEAGLSELPERDVQALRELASHTTDLAVLDILRIVSGAAREARTSSLPRVVIESAVLAAASLRSAVGVADLPPVAVPRPCPAPVRSAPPEPAASRPVEAIVGESADSAGNGAGPAGVEPEADVPAETASADEGMPAGGPADGGGPGPDGGAFEREREKEITRDLLDLFDAVSYDDRIDRRRRR